MDDTSNIKRYIQRVAAQLDSNETLEDDLQSAAALKIAQSLFEQELREKQRRFYPASDTDPDNSQ